MLSGIYKIICIITAEFYVGSAVDLLDRFRCHKKDLKKHKHHNRNLQEMFDNYGLDNFVFEVLEYVEDKNNLIAREQYYINTLKPTYNICKIAGSRLGTKASEETKHRLSESLKGNKIWLGKHHTEESKLKQSESHKGNKHPNYGKHATKETRYKISESLKGVKRSEETKLKLAESKSKSFKLLSPQGQIFEGINLKKFCIENNLGYTNVSKVINNKQKSYKGWTTVV